MSTNTAFAGAAKPTSSHPHNWTIALALAWATTIVTLAILGTFDVPADQPAIGALIAIVVPVSAFGLAMALSSKMRDLALNLDPVLLTEFQAWRILGGLFLAVYAFGHLPGFFAWPAGLGDVAVGIAAPFMAWRIRTDPSFLTNSRLRSFHYVGLLDFAIAVSAGIAARNQIPGFVDSITTTPMGQMPLVLIPALIVPAFIILHIISLMQIHHARHQG